MSNVLIVTHEKIGDTFALKIDDSNKGNRFDRKSTPQEIQWHLKLEGARGSFNKQDNPYAPGFAWVASPPNEGIFGPPTLTDGTDLEMLDAHVTDDSEGTWYYRLAATINGHVYLSAFEGIVNGLPQVPTGGTSNGDTRTKKVMGTGNPTIKNR